MSCLRHPAGASPPAGKAPQQPCPVRARALRIDLADPCPGFPFTAAVRSLHGAGRAAAYGGGPHPAVGGGTGTAAREAGPGAGGGALGAHRRTAVGDHRAPGGTRTHRCRRGVGVLARGDGTGPPGGLAAVARAAGWWWPYERVAVVAECPPELHRGGAWPGNAPAPFGADLTFPPVPATAPGGRSTRVPTGLGRRAPSTGRRRVRTQARALRPGVRRASADRSRRRRRAGASLTRCSFTGRRSGGPSAPPGPRS
ncbi:DUF6745 domain-containing protein [Streptomyces sp. HK10]|uniref:DUF6745 domain-containing protein n=1 Tax=Streptomyces sp. HK10 TaxID=3373255 RepID=UPI0037481EFD